MADSTPPASLRSLIALITAVTGLVGALAAYHKAPEERLAKESYTVVQPAIDKLTAKVTALTDRLDANQRAFEEYVRAKEGEANVEPQPAPLAPGQAPSLRVHVKPSRPHPAPSAVPSVAVTGAVMTSTPPPPPPPDHQDVVLPPPPAKNEMPDPQPLPSIDSIEKRSKK
jgi:hypothetical protein